MFKSYLLLGEKPIGMGSWETHYQIIDTEFVEETTIVTYDDLGPCNVICAVIKVYGKLGLNVAANIVLALKWIARDHASIHGTFAIYTIDYLIILCDAFVEEFRPYKEEIKKYLALV